MTLIPTWCEPIELANWQVQSLFMPRLHVSCGLPTHWHAADSTTTPHDTSLIYRGIFPPDMLTIHFMHAADPHADITNWVNGILSVIGFPCPELITNNQEAPQLLEWEYLGDNATLAERLTVDEAHLFTGVGALDESDIGRLYFLLARRNTWAWKIALSLTTACLPGVDDATIYRNDHVRAGAILGNVKFS